MGSLIEVLCVLPRRESPGVRHGKLDIGTRVRRFSGAQTTPTRVPTPVYLSSSLSGGGRSDPRAVPRVRGTTGIPGPSGQRAVTYHTYTQGRIVGGQRARQGRRPRALEWTSVPRGRRSHPRRPDGRRTGETLTGNNGDSGQNTHFSLFLNRASKGRLR